MAVSSIENLIRMARDEPEKLTADLDLAIEEKLVANESIRLIAAASEKFASDWAKVCALRGVVEESLSHARKLYRDVLKKTEVAARHGRPRLYWLAKALFSGSRRQSLEYQIREAEIKIAALQGARAELAKILVECRPIPNDETQQLLSDREFSEHRTKRHAVDLQVAWEKYETCLKMNQELNDRAERQEIQRAVSDAVVCEVALTQGTPTLTSSLRKIDSPRMLLSKLPHVGFANRPRLMSALEQSEYAAEHAENDLEKVREGLRLANEAAVEGRASSLSVEWLEYCRSIVSRYENVAGRLTTPR